VFGHGGRVAQRAERPGPGRPGIGHRLLSGEGLRGDDEQRLGRIEAAHGLGEVCAVHVGHKAAGQVAGRVVAQGLVGHHRTEVRSADANVDDRPDALAGVARPRARTDTLGKGGHPVQDGVHVGDDIAPIDPDVGLPRRAQGDVQHRPALGDVDFVAAEHRVDALAQPALLGQRDQQAQGLIGDPVLGEVEIQPFGLADHSRPAPGILGE
jgi:hypothetical protein